MEYEGGAVLIIRSALEQLDHVMAAVMDELGGVLPQKMYDLALTRHPAMYLFEEDETAASAVQSWIELAVGALNCSKVIVLCPQGVENGEVGSCHSLQDMLSTNHEIDEVALCEVPMRRAMVDRVLGHCIDGRFVYGHMVNDGFPVRTTALWRIPGIFSTLRVHPEYTGFLMRDIDLLLGKTGVRQMSMFMHEECGMQGVHRGDGDSVEWARDVHRSFWDGGLGSFRRGNSTDAVFMGRGQWAEKTERDSFVLAPYRGDS